MERRRDEPDERRREQDRPAGDDEQPTVSIDEDAYGASAAESGGVYNADGPTAANRVGDTMGTRDEAPPGEPPESDPYSG